MKTKHLREKLRLRFSFLACTFIIFAGGVFAQDNTPPGNKLRDITRAGSTREWLRFRDSVNINPNTFFADYKNGLDLSNDDDMRMMKSKKDEIGFTHYRYQQLYKGIPVLYGEYIIHRQPDGFIRTANGRLIIGLKAPSADSVSEQQALAAAMQFMHASKYLWQNADMEKELKRQEKNQEATYFPKGELMYAPGNQSASFKSSDYRLTWHFKIYTDDPKVMSENVYVDAVTNQVIHYTDISMNCSGGTGTSAFNGTVSVSTELSGGSYRSHNNCQATNIYVYNCGGGGATNTFYTDADNSWTDQSAVQAQFGAAQTYNYYLSVHGRTSWNNAASDMIVYNNANIPGSNGGVNNACWGCTGNSAIFGMGNTSAATDDWNTDDIMGHEFTHGVTQASAGLVYQDESGALNESFSDIFGEMVESWTEGNCDYLVGADRGAIRSFISPKSYSDNIGFMPDTYKGQGWYVGSIDHGGVHHNSSVQNHWFYLLSEGGSGTNDNGESFSVTGITRYKARLIAYRALTQYLTSSSQFIDARKATLEAASDLYGSCSQEAISVGNAWHAAGVESQSSVYTVNACGSYPASGTFVQAISTVYGGNGCATTITPSSAQVVFTARDKVDLLPGFTAQSGSGFHAYLEPCSSATWGAPAAESDAERSRVSGVVKATNAATLQVSKQPVADHIMIAPNPFSNSFTLTINAEKEGKAWVAVYNSLGVKIKEQTGVNLVKGVNRISFEGSTLASGVYIVEVALSNSKVVKKIIKSN